MPQALPVVISAYNRPKLLHQTLTTCIQHSHIPIELIVVDDHSSMDIHSVVESIKGAHRLRYYRMSRQMGPGIAKTYGASLIESTHPLVLFNGADAYFEPNWSKRLLKVAKDNSDFGIISGGVTTPANLDTPPFKTPLKLEPIERFGLTLLMPRLVWNQTGPFPPHKLGVPSEDVELCEKTTSAGYKIGYTNPGVIVHTGLTSIFWTKNELAEALTRIRAKRPEIYME